MAKIIYYLKLPRDIHGNPLPAYVPREPRPIRVLRGGKLPAIVTKHDIARICQPQGEAAQDALDRDLAQDETDLENAEFDFG